MARASSGATDTSKCLMLLILAAAAFVAVGGGVDEVVGGEIQLSWMFPANETASSLCDGTIGDCAAEEEEEMDSEVNRRILAWRKRYISYGALRKDFIPCSRRGQSYYYCRPGRSANPYRRGCSRITRCARG